MAPETKTLPVARAEALAELILVEADPVVIPETFPCWDELHVEEKIELFANTREFIIGARLSNKATAKSFDNAMISLGGMRRVLVDAVCSLMVPLGYVVPPELLTPRTYDYEPLEEVD